MATKKYVSFDKLSLYDEKIKGLIDSKDAEILASAKKYTDDASALYDAAGSAASAQAAAKTYTDTEVAKANAAAAAAQTTADNAVTAASTADGKAVAAQGTADSAVAAVEALETYVGDIPEGYSETNVIAYIGKKAEETLAAAQGGSSETAASVKQQLDNYKSENNTRVGNVEGDVAALQTALDEEIERATAAEGVNAAAIKAISDDYLKGSDKEELQGNINTVSGAVERLTNGVSAEEIDGVNDLIAYVNEHGTEVTGMKQDIAGNTEAINGVAGRMDTAEGNITTLQGAVATKAEKTYVDEADSALSGKISALEAKFGTGEGSVEDMISDAVDAAIESEVTRVDGLLNKKVDKVEGKGLSTNDLTNDLKANYDAAYTHSQAAHAPANAQENLIESVKVNGTAVTITGKAVDISVPVDNSELTNGAGYLVAGDIANKADKATTLSGYGIADAYTKTEADTAIANAFGQFEECSEADINGLFA